MQNSRVQAKRAHTAERSLQILTVRSQRSCWNEKRHCRLCSVLRLSVCLSDSLQSRCQRNEPTAAAENDPPGSEKANTLTHREQNNTRTHTRTKMNSQDKRVIHKKWKFLGTESNHLSCVGPRASPWTWRLTCAHIEIRAMHIPMQYSLCLFFFSWIHPFCGKRVPAHQPASHIASPEPAGTFALWLQFPGMPNLRQLLRTCYLCQQCAGSAHYISCRSVSIWVRDWICVCVCLFPAYCIFLFPHLYLCFHLYARMNSLSHVCSVYMDGCEAVRTVHCACVCLCVFPHLCVLGLPCLHLEQHWKGFPTRPMVASLPNSPDVCSVRLGLNGGSYALIIQE